VRREVDVPPASRSRVSDLGSLLALPAIWMDQEPSVIADGLLDVLSAVLDLDGAYARFDDPEEGDPVEARRPAVGAGRDLAALAASAGDGTRIVPGVARVAMTLGGTRCLVVVSADRRGFPDPLERQVLAGAAEQAAIAVRTARRLARAEAARTAAEQALARRDEVLALLLGEVDPQLRAIAQRVHDAARSLSEPAERAAAAEARTLGEQAHAAGPVPALTPRETQVLRLVAQGLSNKELAGVLRLSHRTVERHVTGLYRKLGVARRSEATAFALRHGLG
jgi:DNA-binding CsgD family transcriptional regulator